MVREILLNQGKVALVDDCDYENLMAYTWTFNPTGYAQRKTRNQELQPGERRRTVPMHRQILNAPRGASVDHIDGNGLNNQRRNLRLADQSSQMANCNKRSNNTTGYKGVFLDKRRGARGGKRYKALIGHHYKIHSLGLFATPEEAALAYNAAAERLFGEFARFNEVSTIQQPLQPGQG